MPIKKLKRNEGSNFPNLGKLFKGGKKRTNANGKEIMGLDLKHFRFESQDLDAMKMFETAYGKEPTSIDVYLVHPTPDESFQFWQEEYRGGNLMHRCDGETCVMHRLPNGQMSSDPKPCPGNCKQVGRMSVIIPQLMRFAYVTVETHSKLDILQLQDNLNAAYSKLGDLTKIPFVLSRRDRDITYVDDSGKPKNVTKSLLYMEVKPEVMKTYLMSIQHDRMLAAGMVPPRMLSDNLVVNVETGEILESYEDDDEPAEKTQPATIKDTIAALYSAELNEDSQYQFARWLIQAFTKQEPPKHMRDKESQLNEAEVARLVKNLNEKKDVYIAAYLKHLGKIAAAELEAQEKAAAEEAARETTPVEIEGEVIPTIAPPETELVAA